MGEGCVVAGALHPNATRASAHNAPSAALAHRMPPAEAYSAGSAPQNEKTAAIGRSAWPQRQTP